MLLNIGAQDLCIAVERCVMYQFRTMLMSFNKDMHSCTNMTGLLRWNSCIISNEKIPQTMMFSRHARTSGNHSVEEGSKPSEVLDVNFELGNEVWDDFDDESLIEVMNFSAGAENTAVSGTVVLPTKSFQEKFFEYFYFGP